MINPDNDFDSTGLPARVLRPGDVLLNEFLIPFKVSCEALAAGSGLDMRSIDGILIGKVSLTVELASRLDAYFGMDVGFWMMLQQEYDQAAQVPQCA